MKRTQRKARAKAAAKREQPARRRFIGFVAGNRPRYLPDEERQCGSGGVISSPSAWCELDGWRTSDRW